MKKFYNEPIDFPVSEITKQEIEYRLTEEKLIFEIKEELYCKSRYRTFFDHYNEESIHAFIDGYARRKAFYLLNGQRILSEEETGQLYFRNLAEHYIWEIQQKKLFDLHCLWRAGQADSEAVQVTKDFLVLESTIKDCTLIDGIAEAEVKLYIDYLLSDDYADKDHAGGWQNYERIKSGDWFMFSTIPAWYEFHNAETGSGNLLSLPDSKGEKEKLYIHLLESENSEETTSGEDEITEQPSLNFNYKTIEFFINTFEDKQIVKYFYTVEKNHPEIDSNGELNEALYLLQLSDEKVPVQSNRNWKEAVINAAKQFRKKKIASALMQAFYEYKLRIKTGLPFYNETDLLRQQLIKGIVDKYKQQILKARQLNGEPADFNY